jgi:phospholipid/cholesterol/gamma-HCH transport system permease protein
LSEIDTAASFLIFSALNYAGVSPSKICLSGFLPTELGILELARDAAAEQTSELRAENNWGVLEGLGRAVWAVLETVSDILSFVGQTTVELFYAVSQPKRLRLKEIAVQLESAGLNAIPIVCLLNFLIGVVMAYLLGVQTERYGANIFVVDGVSLAMCRELSPILVAIIVAGRSGSAFTAQIGAMKINEEIDAMITLNLSPIRVLVVPRLLALMMVMPLLVFFADVAGILGGMVVADLRLGVTGATFLDRLQSVLWVKSVVVGLVKAPVFGLFVATIGCRMGLVVENNARSLGEHTTDTVVRSIVAVILLNAAFAVVFSELGI